MSVSENVSLRMNSENMVLLDSLLSKTESNIKLIQEFGRAFLCAVLNEWRYATRHVVSLMMKPGDEEETRKSVSHLKRAYYDSCDILIDCLLQRIADYSCEYVGYAGVVAVLVPDFNQHTIEVRAAQAAHRKAKSCPPEKREEEYESLTEHVENLLKFAELLEATKDVWMEDVRKQKSRDQLPIIWTIIGIGVSIVLALIFN